MSILNFFTENFWATCTLLVTATITLTELINSKLNPNGIWKQVISWLVSILLTVVTYFGGVAIFSEPEWLSIIATGIIVGLSSNGIYDIPQIKSLVKLISLKKIE